MCHLGNVNTIFPVPELRKSTFEHGHVDRRMKGRSRIRFSLELQPTKGSPRFSYVILWLSTVQPDSVSFCKVV